MKKVKVHKTCPSWGVTQCGMNRWGYSFVRWNTFKYPRTSINRNFPKTTERWRDVTCKRCLKGKE